MSIPLAEELPRTAGWLMLFAVSAAAVGAMQACGAFARRDGESLGRLFERRPIGPMGFNAAVSVLAYLGASVLVLVMLRVAGVVDLQHLTEETIPPMAMLLLSVTVPAAMLTSLLVGLRFIVPGRFATIGLTRPLLRPRVVLPAIGFLLAFAPLMFLVANAAEWVYRTLKWEHATEHPLLQNMDAAGGAAAKALAVVAAVVLAPLSEEILFRGHLQTLIRNSINRAVAWYRLPPRQLPPPLPPMATAVELNMPALPVVAYAPPAIPVAEVMPLQPTRSMTAASVIAVVLTSLMFAVVHPWWSRPQIFVLSLFLGLAYERRGNLWTTIAMHVLFNAIMITGYLFLVHPNS